MYMLFIKIEHIILIYNYIIKLLTKINQLSNEMRKQNNTIYA
jgi:hypothetical protein